MYGPSGPCCTLPAVSQKSILGKAEKFRRVPCSLSLSPPPSLGLIQGCPGRYCKGR
jgi:hypothetical protein